MSLPKALSDQIRLEIERVLRHRHDSREGCRAIDTDMQIKSRVGILPPLKIRSRALVKNLNAQFLQGKTAQQIIDEAQSASGVTSLGELGDPVLLTGNVKLEEGAGVTITRDDVNNALELSSPGSVHNILSATHPDTLADSIVAGDLLYGNATPKLARRAKDSDGKFLKMVGGFPTWSDWGWNDDFGGASLGNWWDQVAGNGTISVASSKLIFSCNAGVNCDWWGGATENAPYVQLGMPDYNWDFEIKIASVSGANMCHGVGICLLKSRDNVYQFYYVYDGSWRVLLDKIINDAGSSVVNATIGSQTVVWLRLRRRGYNFYFDYSTNGTDWTNLNTQTKIDLDARAIGVWAKNWNTYPALNEQIEYAKLTVYYPLV